MRPHTHIPRTPFFRQNHLSNEGINPLPEPTASLIHYLTVPLFYLPSSVDRDGSTLLVFNARYWVADEAGTRRMLKVRYCHVGWTFRVVARSADADFHLVIELYMP